MNSLQELMVIVQAQRWLRWQTIREVLLALLYVVAILAAGTVTYRSWFPPSIEVECRPERAVMT